MALTVPASDVASTDLASRITTRTALITAAQNAGNHPLAATLIDAKVQDQINLVSHLMAVGKLKAATILANETYGT